MPGGRGGSVTFGLTGDGVFDVQSSFAQIRQTPLRRSKWVLKSPDARNALHAALVPRESFVRVPLLATLKVIQLLQCPPKDVAEA